MKLCLVSGAGGHFSEMLKLQPVFRRREHYFVSSGRVDVASRLRGTKYYTIEPPYRSPLRLIRNLFQSARIFFKEKPDVIITTGAGIAWGTCMLAWCFRRPVIHVECSAQVEQPSLFGRLIAPFTRLTVVQWPDLLEPYGHKAVHARLLFDGSREVRDESPTDIVFCTVGTTREDFSRLLTAVDEWASTVPHEHVLVQRGYSSFKPKHCDTVDFLPMGVFQDTLRRAKLVIAHGGVGCIANALTMARATIVVPRLKHFGEHANDHQLQIARELQRQGLVRVVEDVAALADAASALIDNPLPPHRNLNTTTVPLATDVVEQVLLKLGTANDREAV